MRKEVSVWLAVVILVVVVLIVAGVYFVAGRGAFRPLSSEEKEKLVQQWKEKMMQKEKLLQQQIMQKGKPVSPQ